MSELYFDDGSPKNYEPKVMLATTAYENPDASYTFSISAAREELLCHDFDVAYYLLTGNCHVDDARNSIVAHFLKSDCDDLVFIDADVSFEAEDLVTLCGFYDVDIVGGVYPWRRMGERGSTMPVRMLKNTPSPDEQGLIEVEGLPTGFMRIRRKVLEEMARISPYYHAASHPDMDIPLIFDRAKPSDEWRHAAFNRWGGDLRFCMNWREMGGKVHVYPEFHLGHAAKYIVKDSMGAVLRRNSGQTLRWVCDRIKKGTEKPEDFVEAFNYVSNPTHGADPAFLAACVVLSRKVRGPTLEAGSGLSTVLLAAAKQLRGITTPCSALEHDSIYAEKLRRMVKEAGVNNVGLGARTD